MFEECPGITNANMPSSYRELTCTDCGATVEVFSVDTESYCAQCGNRLDSM